MNKTITLYCSALALLLSLSAAYAQDGMNDPSFFNPSAFLTTTGILDVTLQPDNKIIVCGGFQTYNGVVGRGICRVNADGTVDGTFSAGTGADAGVTEVAIQQDGKIIIGGFFSSYNGTAKVSLARLNANGSIDASFLGTGTNAGGAITAIALQTDGKIVIGGTFTSYNGTLRNSLIRLNTNGSVDLSFNFGTGLDASSDIRDIVIQPDGKILVGGHFVSYNGIGSNSIMRLNTDGSPDASFISLAPTAFLVASITLQPDGKIITGGDFASYNNVLINNIARLNPDGTLDATFTTGTGASNEVLTTSLQSNGKIIIGGYFTSYNGAGRNYVTRLNADGTLDPSFSVGSGVNYVVEGTLVQPNGAIIVCGYFTSYNGESRNHIVKLYNSNGTKWGINFNYPIPFGLLSTGSERWDMEDNATANGFLNDYGQPSDDIFYTFTLSQAGLVTLDHCNSVVADTYLYLFDAKQMLLRYDDDNGPICSGAKSSLIANLAAGTYYVASEGYYTNNGSITTHVLVNPCTGNGEGTSQGAAIVVPIATMGGACYGDTKNNAACYNNFIGQPSKEIYYKVVISSPLVLNVHTIGSGLADTYLHLLNSSGTQIAWNDDNGPWSQSQQASLSQSLTVGTYYIVVEGYSTYAGSISLTVWNGSVVGGSYCIPLSPSQPPLIVARTASKPEEVIVPLEVDNSILLYPNPARGKATLVIPQLEEPTAIMVSDGTGKVLSITPATAAETELNTAALSTGLYYVSFKRNGKTFTRKLQVVK